MNKKLPFCLGLLLCLLSMAVVAQQPTLEWARSFDDKRPEIGSLNDFPAAIAIDSEGNSYVTGGGGYWPSDDSGFSSMTTIKYSPSGKQLWISQLEEGISGANAIAIDNHGGVYITGESRGSYVTVRYNAATGKQDWLQRYGRGRASAITVDNQGSVYVTGTSLDSVSVGEWNSNYATICYDATTGKQKWVKKYDSGNSEDAWAIAVDSQGGVYVTGRSGNTLDWDYITISYDASTGQRKWIKRYGGLGSVEEALAIAVDNQGGVYVTGRCYNYVSGGTDVGTIRYDAASGKQIWEQQGGTDIVVDNAGGVYVTGYSNDSTYYNCGNGDQCTSYDYITVRYDAATGKKSWINQYGQLNSDDEVRAIAVDNQGGVYVTGTSGDFTARAYATVRFDAATGKQTWAIRHNVKGPYNEPSDLAVDREGNVFVTGRSQTTEKGYDFLTLKYSQEGVCPPIKRKAIAGNLTAKVGTEGIYALAPGSGATSFAWEITGSDGKAFTGFLGQGTDTIAIPWPKTPDVYRISVSYSTSAGCAVRTAITHVHVFDPEAGFVTGAGWSQVEALPELELMQTPARVQWSLSARYQKGEQVHGQVQLRLQGTGWTFESTSLQARTLVVIDNRAYFRGRGHITYQDKAGKRSIDERQFGFLVSATDGQMDQGTEEDKLRVKLWVLNPDGSRGDQVFDSQLGCPGASQHYNAPPCQVIEKGNIVIHKPGGLKEVNQQALTAEAQGLQVYPTATADRASVRFALAAGGDYRLELYNAKGALVKRIASGSAQAGQSQQQELRADKLARGLYLVRLTSGTAVQTAKLVVQR